MYYCRGGGLPAGLQQMMATNPQMLESLLQNPEMLQQLLQVPEVQQAMQNPEVMEQLGLSPEMMQVAQRALALACERAHLLLCCLAHS